MRAPQPEQWSMSVCKDDMQKSSSWKALGVDGGEKRSSRDGAAAPSVVQFPMRGVPKLDSRVGRQIAAHIHAEKLAHLEDLPRRAGVETNVFCLACLALSLFRRRAPRLCRGEPRLWRGKPAARCKPVRFSACHMKPLKSPHFFHCPRNPSKSIRLGCVVPLARKGGRPSHLLAVALGASTEKWLRRCCGASMFGLWAGPAAEHTQGLVRYCHCSCATRKHFKRWRRRRLMAMPNRARPE